MFDLISIGAIGIDLFFNGETLTVKGQRFQLAGGGKYFVDHFHQSLGGGGANVAIGVQNHGLKAAVLSKIGETSFKEIIIKQLKEAHVDYSLCQIDKEYENISCILLAPSGEKAVINYRTPHQHLFTEGNYSALDHAKAVYFGNMPQMPLEDKIHIISHLHKNTIFSCVNLGVQDARRKKEQLQELLIHTEMLIVNGHEFADIVKKDHADLSFRQDVVARYLPYMKDKIVVVTEGAHGSYAYVKGEVYHQPAIKPDHILDTTGAGDAYTAGFLSQYLKTKDIPQALESGAQYACKILAKVGAN